MDEALREFVDEADERLVRIGRNLVELGEGEWERDLVDELFRDFHTIKGNAGFFQFGTVQTLAHSGENVLSLLRSGELEVSDEMVDVLLETVEALESLLDGIRSDGEEPEADYAQLVVRLERQQRASSTSEDAEPESTDEQADGEEPPTEETAESDVPDGSESAEPAAEEDDDTDSSIEGGGGTGSVDLGTDESIRVDLGLLDDLMNQMTELILTRNQLQQRFLEHVDDPELERAYNNLDLVTSQLQETIMETRMQPVGRIWKRLPRMVRSLARRHDKEVQLELDGEETELDKNLVEKITDPITHLVRNAVDHGIEPPDERERAGKPRAGSIRLNAFQEEGRVKIQVADDGRGMDPERIGARAVERGLVDADELEELSADEIRQFLFRAGFSTASEVTDVSGRGVGLDVVRENVEEVGGSIRVDSEVGEWTVVELRLPLTLAVIPGLLLETLGQEYVIAQDDVVRLVRVDPDRPEEQLEFIHETPVYRLEDRLLPVVCLDELLGAERRPVEERLAAGEALNVVVTRGRGTEYALVVDDVLDTRDVVVESLPQPFRSVDLYAGGVIKGDRSVAIILDTAGIAMAAELGVDETPGRTESDEDDQPEEAPAQRQEVLWCRSQDDGRIAIPLEMVERLEYVDVDQTHWRGGARFFPSHDELLPLIDVEEVLPERRDEPRNPEVYYQYEDPDEFPVVLYRAGSRQVGLIMTEFLDIVETDLEDRRGVSRPGVAFCTMIDGEITEVIDVPEILDRSDIEL